MLKFCCCYIFLSDPLLAFSRIRRVIAIAIFTVRGFLSVRILVTLFAAPRAGCMAVTVGLAVTVLLTNVTSKRIGNGGVNRDFLIGSFDI
jgi:hypothetical protein